MGMGMELDYTIIGGCLKIRKSVFIKEMLSKDGCLRTLLNWKSMKDFTKEHPTLKDMGGDDMVTVNFTSDSSVTLSQSPQEILGELKAKYKEKIKGKIACRSTYWGMATFFQIDLNSDGDKVEYIS